MTKSKSLNLLRFLSLASCMLAAILMQLFSTVYALSEDQKRVFGKGIKYFNVEDCSQNDQINQNNGEESGSNIYVIGDSLTVGMRESGGLQDKLESANWTVTGIEATESITIDDSIPKIRDNKDNAVSKADVVVVGLGTNKSANPEKKIQEMLNAINSKSSGVQVYWINAYSTKGGYADFNTKLNKFKSQGKINKILDWAGEAKANPGKYNLSSDPSGIHPGPVGYKNRSSWAVDKIGVPANKSSTKGVEFDDKDSSDTGGQTTIDDDGIDPSPTGSGNHQSQTSYGNGKLGALHTNYFALNPGWASKNKLELGDVAMLTYKGKSIYAVYGDNHVGDTVHAEISVRAAMKLSGETNPKKVDNLKGVHFNIFPGTHKDLDGSVDQDKIDQVGAKASGQKLSASSSSSSSSTSSSSSPRSQQSSSESLSADQKISRTFIVGFSSETSKSTIESVVKKYKIAGIFILGTTDAAGSGFDKSFFDKLNDVAGHTLIISSDEEGVFTRYKYSFDFPSAGDMGKMPESEVKDIGKKVGEFLSNKGVNTNLAPVLDVANNSSNSSAGTKNRTFSSSADEVTKKAGAFAEGLKSSGVNPVYKHFPGLGSSSGNTDTSSVTSPSLSELKKKDLKPYESLSNKFGGAVMLDNAKVPGLTGSGEVVSTSSSAIKLLTDDYKFKGLITTDDLGAKGVPSGLPDAIAKSLKAGVDAPLFAYRDSSSLDAAIDKTKSLNVNTANKIQKIEDFVSGTTTGDSGANNISDVCCATGGSGTGIILSGNSPGEKVFNFFVSEMGFDNAHAAAATGNLQQESNFVTTVDNGQGYWGLAQWSVSRRAGLVKKPNNTDLGVQLQYVKEELENHPEYQLKQFKEASSLEEMVYIFVKYYEGAVSSSQERGVQDYRKRLDYAKAWLNKAGGGAGASTPATGGGASDNPGAGCDTGSTGSGSIDGYKNPFRDIKNLGPARIDQGVDYTGSGPIYPVGNAKILSLTNDGWPGGTFIAYKLKDGPASGKTIYFAENCKPIKVKVGEDVTPNDVLCDMIDAYPHIEIGWADESAIGNALAHDVYIEGDVTAYGVNFSELLVKLGAPAGVKKAGAPVKGSLPSGWPSW